MSKSLSIKIVYKDVVRRGLFKIFNEENSTDCPGYYEELHGLCCNLFSEFSAAQEYTLQYLDDENEAITISCDRDVEKSIEMQSSVMGKIPKFTIVAVESQQQQQQQEQQQEQQYVGKGKSTVAQERDPEHARSRNKAERGRGKGQGKECGRRMGRGMGMGHDIVDRGGSSGKERGRVRVSQRGRGALHMQLVRGEGPWARSSSEIACRDSAQEQQRNKDIAVGCTDTLMAQKATTFKGHLGGGQEQSAHIDVLGRSESDNNSIQTLPSTTSQRHPPRLCCKFVSHESYPDGSVVPPGSIFFKSWKVLNDGIRDWPVGGKLIMDGGDNLLDGKPSDDGLTIFCAVEKNDSPAEVPAPAVLPAQEPTFFAESESTFTPTPLAPPLSSQTLLPGPSALPALPAGQEMTITAKLSSPLTEGRYQSYFRVKSAEGVKIGHRMWCAVVVQKSQAHFHQQDDFTDSYIDGLSCPLGRFSNNHCSISDALHSALSLDSDSSAAPARTSSVAPVTPTSLLANKESHQERLWETEIQLLADMGFFDTKRIVPLLKTYIGEAHSAYMRAAGASSSSSSSLPSSASNTAHAQGIERVAVALLEDAGNRTAGRMGSL